MLEALCIAFAFTLGLLARRVQLPPLIGFLAAGFLLHALGSHIGLPAETGPVLRHVAHLGVLLLLFTVGLKLKLEPLLQGEVIGGGLLHFAASCAVFTPTAHYALGLGWREAFLLACALSFSSTVLAAKVLEAKREMRAFHGRVAIGILVLQDVIALAVLSLAGDHVPSPWALLALGLPLVRPVLHRLLDLTGHDELLVLAGMLLALVIGGMGFELVGLSPELGALLVGALLANHPRAKELSDSLFSLKEIFLVGFFLEIGMSGLPDGRALAFALVASLVLPLKAALFFLLLTRFKLRARNAFLSALSLTCYSEFGLIVTGAVLPEWLVPLALTVAFSFVVAAQLNRVAHPLYERYAARLVPFEQACRHPDEQPVELGDARILILGMGRTGSAAYDRLLEREPRLLGLDSDQPKVEEHRRRGRNVLYADAEDSGLWGTLDLSGLDAVVLAMNDIESKVMAARLLRRRGFRGVVVAHTMFPDEAREVSTAGADHTYLTMTGAGIGLAEQAWRALETRAAAR